MKRFITFFVVMTALLTQSSVALAQTYSVTTYNGLTSSSSDVNIASLNNAGVAVGASTDSSGVQKPVKWDASGTCYDLGLLDTTSGAFGQANYINDSGQVVGYCYCPGLTPASYHAFLYSGGTMTDISPSGWAYSFADSISASGLVSGHGSATGYGTNSFTYNPSTATWTIYTEPTNSSIFTNGTVLIGLDNPDAGIITIASNTLTTVSAPGSYSGYEVIPRGMNAQGQFCGELYSASAGVEQACVYIPSGVNGGTGWIQVIPQWMSGHTSIAKAINAFNHTVGQAYPTLPGTIIGFLWTGGGNMIDLNTLVPVGTNHIGDATAINDHDTIACTSSSNLNHPMILTRTS